MIRRAFLKAIGAASALLVTPKVPTAKVARKSADIPLYPVRVASAATPAGVLVAMCSRTGLIAPVTTILRSTADPHVKIMMGEYVVDEPIIGVSLGDGTILMSTADPHVKITTTMD